MLVTPLEIAEVRQEAPAAFHRVQPLGIPDLDGEALTENSLMIWIVRRVR
jgi:hypothetical protein